MDIGHSLRMAGLVTRYHTWPTIQRQSIASHTWQVYRIWLEIFGQPSSEVAAAIILHDVGELKTGDLPHYVKRDHADLKELVSSIEADYTTQLVNDYCHDDVEVHRDGWELSPWDKRRLKICDLIEMGEFALDEYRLGSQFATIVFRNVQRALRNIIGDTPHGDILRAQLYFGSLETSWGRARVEAIL